MSRKSIRRIILFLLLNFGVQMIVMSYYNLYISNTILPMRIIVEAVLVSAVLGTLCFAVAMVFYNKFLEYADAYLDRCLNEDDLSEEKSIPPG